ncbi:MAG: pyridoxal phosphate-dependent aminotransferase [Acidobacteriota bacterium]
MRARNARFSSRLSQRLSRNRLAIALERRLQRGEPILDLTESNPTRVGIPYPAQEIAAALSTPRLITYEACARGLRETRECVAEWLGRRGPRPSPEDLLLTAGSSEAYAYLFKLLLDPGDAALVPQPSYPLLDLLARLEAIRLIPYRLVHDGRWSIDLDSLYGAADPRAKVLMAVHPNNPTGSYLTCQDARALVEFCRQRRLSIICDEVFFEYSLGASHPRRPTLMGTEEVLTFCLDGLSKSAGLPQMKLGWICISGPDSLRREALERLELIADTFLTVGAPVQLAAPQLLELGAGVRASIQARTRGNLEWLRAEVRHVPTCTLLEPEGGWSAVLRLPATRNDEEWALELLEADGVRVHPGYFYDFREEAVLVLSLLPEPASFREAVARLLGRARQA